MHRPFSLPAPSSRRLRRLGLLTALLACAGATPALASASAAGSAAPSATPAGATPAALSANPFAAPASAGVTLTPVSAPGTVPTGGLRSGQLRRAAASGSARPYSPAGIRQAYGFPARGAARQKVAIISAYNDPSVAGDLAAYDRYFHLPACTLTNGCLSIHNEQGKSSPLPVTDPTRSEWETETSLGTQTVHGICESCQIMLFEANTPTSPDLSATVNAAAKAGATVIVTTFEPVESSSDTDYALDFSHAHTAIVSATGEALNATYGYSGAINFPSSLPDVLAVGGTVLHTRPNGTYASEQAWSDTVSGCALFSTAAPWQAGYASAVGCGQMRAVADLSAVSDPGVYTYASHITTPGGPWYQATGTSVAAPIIAAAIGLAGSLGSQEAPLVYAHAKAEQSALHHITTGKTSPTCHSRICEAGPRYNGPTGLGTPNGLTVFLPHGGALPTVHPDVHVTTARAGASRAWRVTLSVDNALAIPVFGHLALLERAGRRLIRITGQAITLSPLSRTRESLLIPGFRRGALARAGTLRLTARLLLHGVGGPHATVSRLVTVRFPR
ncbi:hypothetical protein [Conexibacter sp. DBS9H8]|uniref:hypothetical protein n=1 Tax=Conexibacter sp. DBS9H8 TaxID=2937801 RepID=UPI0020107D0B|nr:hypothetical protein [Conexibacter sp. DBS9H8]